MTVVSGEEYFRSKTGLYTISAEEIVRLGCESASDVVMCYNRQVFYRS